MKWLGLTGGIASGKSTVSRFLQDHGIPVIDADEIARQVVQTGTPGLRSIVEEFGHQVLLPDGTLDRRKLGQVVFGRPDLLSRLEAILHPLIRAETLRQRKELERRGVLLAVYDMPLLFETKAEEQFDSIVVVSCTQEQQRERLRRRNSLSESEIEERLASQLSLSRKEKGADFVVHNDGDEKQLAGELERLLGWLELLKN